MIMPLRRGLPNHFLVTSKLNPATEPGDAIATQATEITRLRKGVDGRPSQLCSADVLISAELCTTTSRLSVSDTITAVNSFTAICYCCCGHFLSVRVKFNNNYYDIISDCVKFSVSVYYRLLLALFVILNQ